ncbi:uncharacterized protein LOC110858253 isoform X2 [Folsomia candida]|uniref:uncharacterized protein LOC110858253 isoform X2 n=1 Tax=Folsomia candida TaxID=158441 RepID=UPI001604C3E4|nr:uncharacterized protein LOC110858253 isoform X2 [Folsomia candida]
MPPRGGGGGNKGRVPSSSLEKVCYLLLTSFSVVLLASPVRDPATCGPSLCNAESSEPLNKFQYREGSVYSYAYTVNGTTSVLGGPPTQSGLHLTATVSLRFLTACDALLFMSNVSLHQSHLEKEDAEPSFSLPPNRFPVIKALEEHPLRFSFADGAIEEICPHLEESSWALNIKRGFLSAYQNTMRRLDLEHNGQEGDVHGSCKVEYNLGTATSSALTIHKTKDLSSCGDKFGILSSVQGTPYTFGTLHQSMPAVESTSSCQHVVDRNLLSGVYCTESHRLRSLARGAAGAYMSIRQNLVLTSVYSPPGADNATDSVGGTDRSGSSFDSSFDEDENDDADEEEKEEKNVSGRGGDDEGNAPWIIRQEPDDYTATLLNVNSRKISRRESLLFRHDYNLGQSRTDYDTARNALLKFCSSIKGEVDGKAGELFEILIYILRGLSSHDMMSLSKDAAQICQGDREPLDDALEVVGTAVSLAILRERILKGDASPERTQTWIQSLSFIPKPDLSLLTEAVSILRARDKYPHILLSYSNLAHSYCQAVGHQTCSQAQPVIILSKLYEKYFEATGCSTKKRKELDQALVYLKGLGNFGMYSTGTVGVVMTCLSKSDKNEVRVAAIEALRRMPCENGAMIPALKAIFQNQLEDSEVRISAFLGIMRCPSYPVVVWIKEKLEKEQVNQVGSFVWTYLTNLQETALPSRAELASLLADETFNTKFSSDIRKFSRNFELSTFYEDANFGVAVDGNVVFSQDSYLPRSTSANLTVDLFGESINVFEATLRMESFEHYVESILRPKSSPRSGSGPARSSSSSTSTPGSGSGSKRREKRAILSKRKMRNLTADYDYTKRYHGEPIASVSLRTFGKEIFFRRWVGLGEQIGALSSLNPAAWMRNHGGGGGEDTNWQKSRLLLESSYIIPTGSGFALNLSAQASTIIRLESQSLIDSSGSGFAAGGTFHVKGKFIPSALLAVAGSMTLSAFEVHTGLKIRAYLRSSLALEGGVAMDGVRLLDVEFGLPKSRLELLEYKSELMFMKGDEFKGPKTSEGLASPQICSAGDYTGGLRLCSSSHFSLHPEGMGSQGDVSFAPYFPLNGPSHFTLSLDKANPALLKTRFHYGWNNNQTTTELTLETTSLTRSTGGGGGGGGDSTLETKLGLSFTLDKKISSFDTEILLPSNTRFKAFGRLGGPDWTSGSNLNITLGQGQLTMFSTSASLKRESQSGRESGGSLADVLKPSLLITRKNQVLLRADGEVNINQPSSSTTTFFQGSGDITFGGGRDVNIRLDGSHNVSTDVLNWVAVGGGETIQFRSTLGRHFSTKETSLGRGIESQFSLQFSKAPHRNLAASWKYQVGEEGLLGKSLASAISLSYAGGKRIETSLVMKRAPGVLTFLELGWNATIPDREPLQVSFHFREKAKASVYQALLRTDWHSDKLLLDVEYSDRSRRTRLDLAFSAGITTKALDNLKCGFHVLSEEMETKVQLSSDYQNEHYAVEVGHNRVDRTGKKHKVLASLSIRDAVYVAMGYLNLEHGLHATFKTVLGPKFNDIYAQISATSQGGGVGGMQLVGLEYRWGSSSSSDGGQTPKILLIQFSADSSRKNVRRLVGNLTFPNYEVGTTTELFMDPERRSAKVVGLLGWRIDDGEVGHLHLNGRLGPRQEENDESFDASLQLATPFPSLKNVSLHMELDFLEDGAVCQIKFDSSWRDEQERLGGSLRSRLQEIQREEQGGGKMSDDDDDDDDGENENMDDENEIYNNHEYHHQHRNNNNGPNPFKFSCEGNFFFNSSTISTPQLVKLKFNHVFLSYFNTKTDLDIQLPNEKEISVSSQWVLPRGWRELLSTRAELHIKTPFIGYQNVDLQGILGRKEDRDVLALIGIYVESFQYAISITGTPRFEQDGALGFDLSTSNPKYDKIFGSLSYVFGDTTRVACQVGWPPQVVVGLEAGWEWVDWGDFKIYHTLNTPWIPVKHVDVLLKVDDTQSIELKLEANEDSIKAKCEWIALSWINFDIRLDGTSPFEVANKYGFILKNSWEDELIYDSQAVAWINEQQVGVKLDGGQSEVEEEDGVAIVLNSQLEVDMLEFYPQIRGLFTLAQRESRFNLASSLTLREGPINCEASLDLLDMFRFNENITITTPFSGLLQLEIGLNPAILVDKGVYNFALDAKWRSYSDWHTAGLWIRWGGQDALSEVLTQEARDIAFLTGTEDQDYEAAVEKVTVPMSQLVHFYSPLAWAKLVKLEYEGAEGDEKLNGGDDDENDDANQFAPGEESLSLRKFEIAYSADVADIKAEINNAATRKRILGVVDVRVTSDEYHPSFKVDGLLDLSEAERTFSLSLGSYSPTVAEYSLSSSWSSDLPHFLQGKVEARTPLERWEEQTGSVMYAHNKEESSYSVDVELSSITFDKFATNVMVGPKTFSMTLSTPIESLTELELRGDVSAREGEPGVNTLIVAKCGEKEIEFDVDSELSEEGWPTQLTGTVSTTFGPETYRHGTFTGDVAKWDGGVNASGLLRWENVDDEMRSSLYFHFPQNRFKNMKLTVDSPFPRQGQGQWELVSNRLSLQASSGLQFNLRTPLAYLPTLTGQALLDYDGVSPLELKKLALQAEAPGGGSGGGVIGVNSTWTLSSWNGCNFGLDFKYAIPTLANYTSFPPENGMKLKFRNIIPTMDHFTRVDTRFLVENSIPLLRLGAGISSEYVDGESLMLKATSKYGKTFANLDLTSNFDPDFEQINVTMSSNATGFHSHGNLQMRGRREGSASLGWGDGGRTVSSSLLHSTFNCSWPSDSGGESRPATTVHLRLFDYSVAANNTITTPLISIDGSFNRISAQHSARSDRTKEKKGESRPVSM